MCCSRNFQCHSKNVYMLTNQVTNLVYFFWWMIIFHLSIKSIPLREKVLESIHSRIFWDVLSSSGGQKLIVNMTQQLTVCSDTKSDWLRKSWSKANTISFNDWQSHSPSHFSQGRCYFNSFCAILCTKYKWCSSIYAILRLKKDIS